MTILSDIEIIDLCTPPKFVIKTVTPSIGPNSGVYYLPTEDYSYSKLNEEQLDKLIKQDSQSEFGVKSYRELNTVQKSDFKPMINPFVDHQVRIDESGNKAISHGLSSYGYDVRLADNYKIFTNINNALIDPLNMSDDCYVNHKGPWCIIPPNSYALGHTVETFHMPRDVTAICLGKSTYARCAAIVNVTPIEAGFIGQVVIEISNASNLPLKVYSGMGIAQFLFLKGSKECKVSYAEGGRKYQNQQGLQTALI